MATIVDPFVSYFVNKLATMAEDEVARLLGVPAAIKQLKEKVSTMEDLLLAAERRQFREPEFMKCLNRLRDVMYDADDIIDEYVIKTERPDPGLPKLSARFFHSSFSCFATCSLRHSVGNRMEGVLKRLDEIKSDYGSSARGRSSPTSSSFEYRGNSLLEQVESEVVGTTIDGDARMLVDLLLKPSHEAHPLVYAIAGMAGIGKTTLARKIFNHERIQTSFSQPAWVGISEDSEGMTKKIMMDFTGDSREFQNLQDLENKLRQHVAGKKFFLVLDGVRNIEVWDKLLKRCRCNADPGSRILVTTRDRATARRMGAERCHEPQKLSHEDSWSLLCKMVFRGRDEREKQNLKDIGMRIVAKCDGLPLALEAIGRVLSGRDLIQAEWEKAVRDSAWSFEQPDEMGLGKQVMGALYPSYEDLSPQQKQCFVYCALFPEGHTLRQDMLVPLWIAEGFIKASKDPPMEDTAEEYWKLLVDRSLLQADPAHYDQGGCKMHHVVRSLALHLAPECFSGDAKGFANRTDNATSSSPKIRRVLIKDAEGASIPDVIKEPTCLRTIIFLDTPLLQEDFFKRFTCLRVLDLSGAPNSKLPDAVYNLVQLRYLNLSRSQITEIPNAIGRLANLQFLGLGECGRLRILPDAIVELRNLRALDVGGTHLEGMPKGIGNLQHLRRLVGFRVNGKTNNADRSGAEGREGQDGRQRSPASRCTLEELKSLIELKFLMIQNLERISSADGAEKAKLSIKKHLDDLRLICSRSGHALTDQEKGKIKEVFDKLCPPKRLQLLEVGGYFGLEYPSWMMGGSISSHLPDLKHLELRDCFFWETLPPLGLLPHLEILHISGAAAVKNIGIEFLLGHAAAAGQAQHRFPAFPKLKHLALKNMVSWKKWWWKGEEDPAMAPLPLLEDLVIESCDKLMSLPKGLLYNVTRLTIEGANLLGKIGNLPSVRTLKIARSGLTTISNLPALENLTIVDCSSLSRMEKIGELQYLKFEHRTTKFLPNWLLNEREVKEPEQRWNVWFGVWFGRSGRQDFVEVRKLEFICCSRLLQRCIKDGPEWPKIRGIPYVKGYTMDKSKYISYDKSYPEPHFETNIEEGEITSETTRNSSIREKRTTNGGGDLASPFSIVILLLLVVGVAKVANDYKSFLLPFFLEATAAIQKLKQNLNMP